MPRLSAALAGAAWAAGLVGGGAVVQPPSTAAHDRTGKFAAYTALPGLQTYLLVEQTQPRIYAYQRTEGDWELTEYESGEIPPDFDTFGAMVQDICYNNAKNYFAIPGVEG